MKTLAPPLVSGLIAAGVLIGVVALVPRLAFLLMAPFAVAGVAAAFAAKKNRVLVVIVVALMFLAVGLGRLDVVIQRGGGSRGVALQKAVWGRVASPPDNAYLGGCEPPRFEPTRVLVIRI